MKWSDRILREPALLLGLATAFFGLLTLFDVPLSSEQVGGITVFIGALVALLRFVLVPSSEVVAQQKPGEPVQAASYDFGLVKGETVQVNPATEPIGHPF